jgi:hypothetical protein
MNPYARLLEAIGGLPDTYLVIDTETNGMQIKADLVLPTELGYLLVVDRGPVHRGSVVVNWAKALPSWRMRDEFWDRVRKTEWNMAQRGTACKVTADRIAAEGEDPRDAWPAYHEMLSTALGNGLRVVGHNIFAFDCPLLEKVGLQMETPLAFAPSSLLDFGLFEKSLHVRRDIPGPDRWSLGPWYRDVKAAYSRGKWSLQSSVEKYGLDGPTGLDPSMAHGAEHDCLCVHGIVEAHRELAEIAHAEFPAS